MPALFMFAFTAEQTLSHKMHVMASETEHAKEVSQWAETHRTQQIEEAKKSLGGTPQRHLASDEAENRQLVALYTKSVEESGVRIVPGDKLNTFHKLANFGQENPFKILAGIAGTKLISYISAMMEHTSTSHSTHY